MYLGVFFYLLYLLDACIPSTIYFFLSKLWTYFLYMLDPVVLRNLKTNKDRMYRYVSLYLFVYIIYKLSFSFRLDENWDINFLFHPLKVDLFMNNLWTEVVFFLWIYSNKPSLNYIISSLGIICSYAGGCYIYVNY